MAVIRAKAGLNLAEIAINPSPMPQARMLLIYSPLALRSYQMDTATAPQRENRIRVAPIVWYMVISFSVREWG
jgi:hypothetical protein